MIENNFADFVDLLSPILDCYSDLLEIFKNIGLSVSELIENKDKDILGDWYQKATEKGAHSLKTKRNQCGIYFSPNNIVEFTMNYTLDKYYRENFSLITTNFPERINEENEDENFEKQGNQKEIQGNQKEIQGNQNIRQMFSNQLSDLENLTIMDPACGSGLFLIYTIRYFDKLYCQILEKWDQIDSKLKIDNNLIEEKIPRDPIQRLKRILSKHIFGIDLDSVSLDLARINIVLEIIRIFNYSTITTITLDKLQSLNSMIEEIRSWPFFKNNLRCGNSLYCFPISKELELVRGIENHSKINARKFALEEEAVKVAGLNMTFDSFLQYFNQWVEDEKIKSETHSAFSWVNSFPNIFLEILNPIQIKEHPGFSIILGNPPWGASHGFSKQYLLKRFNYKIENVNTFELFLLLGFELLKPNGLLSLIIPRNFLKTNDYKQLREILLKSYQIEAVVDISNCFRRVAQEAIILFVKKSHPKDNTIRLIKNCNINSFNEENLSINKIKQSIILQVLDYIINMNYEERIERLLQTIEKRKDVIPLGELVNYGRGIEYGKNVAVIRCKKCNHFCELPAKKQTKKYCKKCGSLMEEDSEPHYIISENKDERHSTPIFVGKHLSKYRLEKPWYLDHNVPGIQYKNPQIFSEKKILIMKISDTIKATLDDSGAYITQALYYLTAKSRTSDISLSPPSQAEQISLEHILGILNSKLMNFYYEHRFNVGASLTTNVTLRNILRLPIIVPNCEALEAAVKKILSISSSGSGNSQHVQEYQKLIKEIDTIVFGLYEFNENDIKNE